MFKFEWDYQKAESNVQKHDVSFDEAVTVFADEMALTFSDSDHSETEDRSRTYGMSNKGRLLVVVHAEQKNTRWGRMKSSVCFRILPSLLVAIVSIWILQISADRSWPPTGESLKEAPDLQMAPQALLRAAKKAR